jgi:hypothetical protein
MPSSSSSKLRGVTIMNGGRCLPKSSSEAQFVRANCICIDRRGAETRMTHPTLNEIERHARLQGVDAEAMPQSARTGLPSAEMGERHDPLDDTPCGLTAELPQALLRGSFALLHSAQAKEAVEACYELRRDRRLAYCELAALQRDDRYHACIQLKGMRSTSETRAPVQASTRQNSARSVSRVSIAASIRRRSSRLRYLRPPPDL